MLDRAKNSSPDDTSWSDDYWFCPDDTGSQPRLQASPIAIGEAYKVTTEDVIDVLGPDADDLLADSKLDMGELVELLNAETMLLPRIDAEFEEEIERALAGDADEEAPEPKRALRKHAQQSPWRKRFLRAAIGAVLLTAAGGGIAAASMNKSVTMDVDGKSTTVNTFSGTVGDVLESEGLKAGPHDTLSPSPNASVADGGHITLDRGRQLNLSIDGVTQQHWVHSGSLGDALRNLGIDSRTAWLSQDINSAVPLAGEAVQLKTLKTITMIDGASAPRSLQTHATTVGELLKSLNINLGAGDSASPSATTPIGNNSEVMISRTGIQVVNKQEDVTPPVQKVNDASMLQGQTKVVDQGTPGKQMVTYRITSVNGKESKREKLAVKVLSAAKPQILHVGTKKPPQPAMSNEALWDKIAGCESTNNWAANTGNGYYGGLQFDRGTWLSNGGGAYAPTADKASKAQQIAVANKVKAARGLSPWQCAGELGMD